MTVPVDIAKEAADPVIRALDVSVFSAGDLVNMVLQRSEVLFDLPGGGGAVKQWSAGDDGPIREVAARLGSEIARRTAGVLWAEYRAMRERLAALAPGRIADIGCGYAMFDLFAARDTGASVLLIDIEQNAHRHFGYSDEGSAYTSLSVARSFLIANGMAEDAVMTVNPLSEPLERAGKVDLAVSFLSCGFHYPVDGYMPFFRDQVAAGGAVIVDLRLRRLEAQAGLLADLGRIEVLQGHPKAQRTLVRKEAA